MDAENAKIELVIVRDTDVRAYAENKLSCEHSGVIEDVLLDDERARRLVFRHAKPITEHPPARALSDVLSLATTKCRASVRNYKRIVSSDGPENVVNFAASLFSDRWDLLDEIRHITDANSSTLHTPEVNHEPPASISDVESIVREADNIDGDLAELLQQAFDVAEMPAWKALIAEWICAIRNDIGRITWLARRNSRDFSSGFVPSGAT